MYRIIRPLRSFSSVLKLNFTQKQPSIHLQGLYSRGLMTMRPIQPLQRGFSDMRTMMRQYGSLAVGVYFTLSFTTFVVCLSSVYLAGITQKDVSLLFQRIKGLIGIEPTKPKEDGKEKKEKGGDGFIAGILHSLPSWAQHPKVIDFGANVLIALGIAKLLIPVKLTVTAAIVPSIARYLKRLGYMSR